MSIDRAHIISVLQAYEAHMYTNYLLDIEQSLMLSQHSNKATDI